MEPAAAGFAAAIVPRRTSKCNVPLADAAKSSAGVARQIERCRCRSKLRRLQRRPSKWPNLPR